MTSTPKQKPVLKMVRIGFIATFAALMVIYVLLLLSHQQLKKQNDLLFSHHHTVLELEQLLLNLQDAEKASANKGRLHDEPIASQEQVLNENVDKNFSALKKAFADDAQKLWIIDNLQHMVSDKYPWLQADYSFYHDTPNSAKTVLPSPPKEADQMVDSIKSAVKAMLADAQNLLKKQTSGLQAHFTQTALLLFFALGITLLFAGIGFIHYQQSLTATKTQWGNQQQLAFQTAALDKANKELVVARRHEKFDNSERIAQSIAHEVRNPLNNIDLAVNQMKTELFNLGENATMLLELIDRNSKRINQLISNLLNEIHLSDTHLQPVQINHIIDEALELAKDRILLMHIKVEKYYGTSLPPILANAEKLRTAFLNLIVNSVESIEHQKGILQISTQAKENTCIVELTDNGAGMKQEVQSKLFEPYFTTKKKGVGLGLTNTRNIIQNHKGSISVASSPGKGTTFTLQFNFNA